MNLYLYYRLWCHAEFYLSSTISLTFVPNLITGWCYVPVHSVSSQKRTEKSRTVRPCWWQPIKQDGKKISSALFVLPFRQESILIVSRYICPWWPGIARPIFHTNHFPPLYWVQSSPSQYSALAIVIAGKLISSTGSLDAGAAVILGRRRSSGVSQQ